MKRALMLAALLASSSVAADPEVHTLPYELDPRPFLLVDAPRRALPGGPVSVRVQKAHGGLVELAVYRLRALDAVVTRPLDRQGVSIAAGPLGAEAEALLLRDGPLPRNGASLDLVGLQRQELQVSRRARRAVGDERAVYDSNEADEGEVETGGVYAGAWADTDVSLGVLPAGVYLVRANAGGWSATAIVSVSAITLLARRGDVRDVAAVTDANGAPVAGVTVQRFVEGRPAGTAQTDARGEARWDALDAASVRFVAVRGDDLAWTDVAHTRAAPCDVRVYTATGRPTFRPRETVNVRGHVRGCVDGRDAPMRRVSVELSSSADMAPFTTVTTDDDGNFVAETFATEELYARVAGRAHRRTLHLDTRPLPTRALTLRSDRAWAASGESVTLTLASPQERWPDDAVVRFETPAGVMAARASGDALASVSFTMPTTHEPLVRHVARASVTLGAMTNYVETTLWSGALPAVLDLASAHTHAVSGARTDVTLALRDLGGTRAEGEASVTVYGSDGNAKVGGARAQQRVHVTAAGTTVALATPGVGPWWIEATAAGSTRASSSSMVLWERARPMTLSARGPLAVAVAPGTARPGHDLDVSLRAPTAGTTWVTLEQGGVWSTRWVPAGAPTRFALDVPEETRGLATVVATHVEGGAVTSASTAVAVETSRPFALSVEGDRRSYNAGDTARVTVRARESDGAPRDAVLSLWVADAGWWSLGDDDQPSPDAYFQRPGRRASAGDSERAPGYGAEEGRRLDTRFEWNGDPHPSTTWRHALGHTTALSRFELTGSLDDIARRLARDAGLSRVNVCPEAARRVGTVHVKVQSVPWDLAAARIASRSGTFAARVGDTLTFACEELGFGGLGGRGSGSGAGCGLGSAHVGAMRAQRLEGTVFFLGTRRLGARGETVVEVPLPAMPGRWRVEALAIADDGAGSTAHTELATTQPITAHVELPPRLAVGDVASGAVAVDAPSLAGRAVPLRVTARGVSVLDALPTSLTLDPHGHASASLRVRADAAGDGELTLEAGDGGAADRVRFALTVADAAGREPLRVDVPVGPMETDVEVRVPALASSTTLRVRYDRDEHDALDTVLDALNAPQWNLPSLRLENFLAATRLRRATPVGLQGALYATATRRAEQGAWAALTEHLRGDGGLRVWRGAHPSKWLTSELVWYGEALSEGDRRDALAMLREGLPASIPTLDPALAARLAAVFWRDRSAPYDALLDRAMTAPRSLDAMTWAFRAARMRRTSARFVATRDALRLALDEALRAAPSRPCDGPHWLLCHDARGDVALALRAATELVQADHDDAPLAARTLAWAARHPSPRPGPRWGSALVDRVVLQLSLRGHDGTGIARVFVDAREVGVAHENAPLDVPVRGGERVTVRVAADEERVARVRIDGELPLASPDTAVGNGRLRVALEPEGADRALVASFTLPTASRDVTLVIPIGAGLAPAWARPEAVTRGGRSPDRWGFDLDGWDWYALDRTPVESRARVEAIDGALHVHYDALRAGEHTLRVPLVVVGRGSFHVASPWMRTGDDAVWSVAPAWRVDLP